MPRDPTTFLCPRPRSRPSFEVLRSFSSVSPGSRPCPCAIHFHAAPCRQRRLPICGAQCLRSKRESALRCESPSGWNRSVAKRRRRVRQSFLNASAAASFSRRTHLPRFNLAASRSPRADRSPAEKSVPAAYHFSTRPFCGWLFRTIEDRARCVWPRLCALDRRRHRRRHRSAAWYNDVAVLARRPDKPVAVLPGAGGRPCGMA